MIRVKCIFYSGTGFELCLSSLKSKGWPCFLIYADDAPAQPLNNKPLMLWDGLGQGWSSFPIWRPIFSCCPHPTPTWWLQLSPQKRERDTKTHWTKLLHTHDNTPTYAHIKEQFICAQFKALLHADLNLLHHAASLKPDWSLQMYSKLNKNVRILQRCHTHQLFLFWDLISLRDSATLTGRSQLLNSTQP